MIIVAGFRKRQKKSSSESSEEEPTVIKMRDRAYHTVKKAKGDSSGSDEDGFDKMERERQEDLKERDEFSKRLKNKDKDKTRNIVSKSGICRMPAWFQFVTLNHSVDEAVVSNSIF